MEHDTTEELHVIVNHLPLDVVATRCPVIVIDSLIAVYGHEVIGWVCCKFAVEVSCSNDSLLILCESTVGKPH